MAPKYIWDPGRLYEQQQFYKNEMGYTIAKDYDPDGFIRYDSDPVAVYQTYLEKVRLGAAAGHKVSDTLRRERCSQPLRSSKEAYAQMERMKATQPLNNGACSRDGQDQGD